jgi:branched-chain amino acid transport system substrate-binding protein
MLGLAACGGGGGGGGGGNEVSGTTLTIYSSLPLQGASRPQSVAVNQGATLALQQQSSKIGKFTVRFKQLDDATPQAGKWDPGQTSVDARKAAQDSTTIGYIGEFNSGSSAISIPILNRAGIPQISPSNTAVGLTANISGAVEPGEPQKYYPTGKRTYARVVPFDTIQAAALATLMKEQGCKKVYILNDKEVYGGGLAKNAVTSSKKQGMTVLANEGFDPKAPNYRSLASKIKGQGADCVLLSTITANNAVALTKDVAAALPNGKLFGPDGVAESTYFNPKEGGIPASIASRVLVTVATLPPDQYPISGGTASRDAAEKFRTDFKAKYGTSNPDPYAIYGYESMKLLLDSVKTATDNGTKQPTRDEVISTIHSTKDRESVLGKYSIDKNGDTSITAYGVYKIKDGELAFFKQIKGPGEKGA